MGIQPANPKAIRVFISYSRHDSATADEFVAALEAEGFTVTIDRRDLPYGEEWLRELTDFIAGSDTVVALISPSFMASKACNWELGQVKATNKRLVPVMIESVPIEELPEAVRKIQLLPAQGTFGFETHLKALVDTLNSDREWIKEHSRLADRARQWLSRDRAAALLLRGSALTDAERWQDRQPKAAPAPSDEILELMLASRRASTRRQRAIMGGSLVAAVFAFALAGAALFQWQRAEKNYAAARNNFDLLIKDLATEMQNAEGMPVTTVNRILKNGQALAGNLREEGNGDARLEASRGAMFYQFGKTYQKINERDEAVRASDESLAIRRRLVAAEPRNEEFAAALAESLQLAGDLEREQKHFPKARELYGEAASIGAALNAKYSSNADYAVNLSRTFIRIGDLDRFDKNYLAAKARYADAFEISRRALRSVAGEPPLSLKRELTWNFNKIGDVSADLKDYGEADKSYRNGLCIREYLFAADQKNTQLRHDISWSLDKVAAAKLKLGDFTGAMDAQFASLLHRRKLVESDPKNLIWRRDQAVSLHQLGEIAGEAGDWPMAISFFVAAAEVRLALKKEAPGEAAFGAAFEASMKQATEARVKKLEMKQDMSERPYREAVAEAEQTAALKAAADVRDPGQCWTDLLAFLRNAEVASN